MALSNDRLLVEIDPSDDSAVQKVVVWVSQAIIEGRYAPGQRIVAADVANELNISRMPVREAFQLLAGQHVLEIEKNKGATVKRLTTSEAIAVVQLAEAICCLGIRLAVERLDAPEYRRYAERAFAVVEAAFEQRDAATLQTALHKYHLALNFISGNVYAYRFYAQPTFFILVHLISEQLPGAHWERYRDNYRLIHEAVMSRNAHAAMAGLSTHIHWAIGLIQDHAMATARAAQDT